MKYSDKKNRQRIYHIYPIHILYTLRWWFHLGSAYLHILKALYRYIEEPHRKLSAAKMADVNVDVDLDEVNIAVIPIYGDTMLIKWQIVYQAMIEDFK